MTGGRDLRSGFSGDNTSRGEALESLREVLFLIDLNGDFLYACPMLAEIEGIRPGETAGKNLADLVEPNHFRILRERLISGEDFQTEWEFTREDGGQVCLRVYISPWRREGEIVGAAGVALDITEEVLAEREMEKKALLLHMQMDVLEHLAKAEGVTGILRVIVDRALEAMGVGAGCLAALYPSERGWLARQVVQSGWARGEARVTVWNEVQGREVRRAMDQKEIFALEEGEGPLEWLEPYGIRSVLVIPILSSPRGGFALMLASSDAREWRKLEMDFLRGLVSIAEQALQRAELVADLRSSEESYIGLANGVSEAIAVVENEKVAFANQSMANLMGYSTPGDMVGAELEDLLSPDSLAELREAMDTKGLVPGSMRLHMRRRKGQEFITEVEITHLPYGARGAYQVMIRSVEELQDEEFLLHFDFLSRLSHDFRTPLVSVSGFADYLQQVLGPGVSPEVEECLDAIDRGLQRLGRLVDNMLALAGTRKPPEEGWASSSTALQAVLEELRESIREGGVEISVQEDLPRIPLPESELQEVLENLLSNALRAVRGVESPRVEVEYERTAGHHLFSIADNGVGIPEEKQEDIFHPLVRLVSGEEGSGLGLSIVRQILKARGGDVWVRSLPGRGTTFYFSIPSNGVTPGYGT